MTSKRLTTIISGIVVAAAVHSTAQAGILIRDNFGTGNLATTDAFIDVGAGFDNAGQVLASESGGNAVLSATGSSTSVITSKDSFNPFLADVTTRSEWIVSSASHTHSEYRTYVGLRNTSSTSDHFLPGGVEGQGLFISIYQHPHINDVLGNNAHQGNLIAVNSVGVKTILESWDWLFGSSLTDLHITLDTTATTYDLTFNQSVTSATGALSGMLTGMGTLPASVEIGAHNQWSGNTLAISQITVSTPTTVPNPSVPSLLVLGLAALGLGRRFRQQ
jgi:hypothetical protein